MNEWGLVSSIIGGVKYCTSLSTTVPTTGNPSFEDKLEPLSLIISLAVAYLLPFKSKPSLSNHRITWDLPSQNAYVNMQGVGRELTKWMGPEKKDHLLIIPLWAGTILICLKLHRSKPSTEDPRRTFLIDFFVNEAKKGLDIKVKPIYAHLTDGTVQDLKACTTAIENDDKLALELSKKPKESKEPSKDVPLQGQKEKEKSSVEKDTSTEKLISEKSGQTSSKVNGEKGPNEKVKFTEKLKNGEKKPTINSSKVDAVKGQTEKDKSTEQLKEDEKKSTNNSSKVDGEKESSQKKNSTEGSVEDKELEKISTNEEAIPLATKVKNIWAKKCYLEAVYESYMDASSIPENERVTSKAFYHSIDAIYGLINKLSDQYERILIEHNNINV